MNCKACLTKLIAGQRKFCSTICQQDFQRTKLVNLWLAGKHNGMRGKTSTAKWIKWYLINRRGEKCEVCGWNSRNSFTKNIPIELDHIDGNFLNNKIENLQLLCPNCHSLTNSYKGANKNNGRPRSKYYRGL